MTAVVVAVIVTVLHLLQMMIKMAASNIFLYMNVFHNYYFELLVCTLVHDGIFAHVVYFSYF